MVDGCLMKLDRRVTLGTYNDRRENLISSKKMPADGPVFTSHLIKSCFVFVLKLDRFARLGVSFLIPFQISNVNFSWVSHTQYLFMIKGYSVVGFLIYID